MKNRILNSIVPAFAKRAGLQPSHPIGQSRTFIVCRRAAGDISFDLPVMLASQPASRPFNLLTLELIMKSKLRKLTRSLGVALMCAAAGQSSQAGVHTWHGEGWFGNKTLVWSDNFNWAEGAPTPGESNIELVFPPNDDIFVTNDIAGLVVDKLTISGTNYVLHGAGGGSSLTLLGSGPFLLDVSISGANNVIAPSLAITLSNTVTMSIATNKTFTMKSIINGAGGLDKGGPGTLTMQTAGFNNTYTGLTAVRNGRLNLNNGGALAIAGDLTIGEPGGTADCDVRYGNSFALANSSAITVYTNGTFELFGYFDTIGSLTLHGGRADAGGGAWTLNGNITTTGYPQLYGEVDFGSVTRTVNTINGGLYANANFTSAIAGVGLAKTGAGYLALYDTNQLSGLITVASGTLIVDHIGALGSTANGTVVSNGASIYIGNFTSVNGEALTVQGSGDPLGGYGAFAFATAANWGGNVTLPADTLVYVLSDSASSAINGTVSGAGKLVKAGDGSLFLGGNNFNSNAGGAEVWKGGLLLNKPLNQFAVVNSLIIGATNGAAGSAFATLYNGNQISDFADVTIRASGIFNTANSYETIGSLLGNGQLNLGTSYFSIGSDNANCTFSGPITGNGTTNLVKVGTGTLNFIGDSTVSGKALVTAGKLAINADFINMPVLVAGAGTLGGTGTVASVTVESGGTLAPGNSPGQMSVLGPLTMQAGSTYAVELNGLQAGTSFDQMAVAGVVTLGNATLQATLANPTAVSNMFTIVLNYNAGGVNGTFNGLPNNSFFYAGNRKFRVRYNGGSGNEVTLTQENTLPMLTVLNAPANAGEGSAALLTGNYTDPDNGDSVKMVVNWGDGQTTTNNVSGGAFAISHTYVDDNPSNTPQDFYSINAYPMDNHGIGFNEITSVLITNVPPTFTPPAGAGLLPGQPLAATIAISDAGPDTFQAYVNYGAGGGAPAVPVVGNLLTLNYSYPSNGTYTVTMLVRDDDLGETLKSFDVIVGMKLSIANSTNNSVKLSWPGIAQNLFVEGKPDVASTNWSVVPIAPTLAGNEFYLNVPKTNAARFFRLGWDPNAQ